MKHAFVFLWLSPWNSPSKRFCPGSFFLFNHEHWPYLRKVRPALLVDVVRPPFITSWMTLHCALGENGVGQSLLEDFVGNGSHSGLLDFQRLCNPFQTDTCQLLSFLIRSWISLYCGLMCCFEAASLCHTASTLSIFWFCVPGTDEGFSLNKWNHYLKTAFCIYLGYICEGSQSTWSWLSPKKVLPKWHCQVTKQVILILRFVLNNWIVTEKKGSGGV